MGTLANLVSLARETLGALTVSQGAWTYVRRQDAVQIGMLLLVLIVATLVTRYVRGRRPGRTNTAVPALPPRPRHSGPSLSPSRHAAFVLFLVGLPFFFLALAAPESALVQEERTYSGHRITILIDASLSMDTAFSTERLRAGNTFLANVAAAEYFVRRRMEGEYHDLVSLIQFGSQAYIVTPFTSDYENVLLSLGLIGTPEEYDRFPDHGTLIMGAITRGVQLFRTFDFLRRAGNLIVIFSDGQDTHARYEGTSLDEILQEASDNGIPVYFIRTSYDQELGDILPDMTWKTAIERTGGKFFPAANEGAILDAIEEIDRLSVGRIETTRYMTRQPQFSAFGLASMSIWSFAVVLALTARHFRQFP